MVWEKNVKTIVMIEMQEKEVSVSTHSASLARIYKLVLSNCPAGLQSRRHDFLTIFLPTETPPRVL